MNKKQISNPNLMEDMGKEQSEVRHGHFRHVVGQFKKAGRLIPD